MTIKVIFIFFPKKKKKEEKKKRAQSAGAIEYADYISTEG